MCYIAICLGSWARGATITEAVRRLEKQDRKGANQRTIVYECGDPNAEVDSMGAIIFDENTEVRLMLRLEKGKLVDK